MLQEIQKQLEEEKVKNREMERKIEMISESLETATLECKKCKENQAKLEEVKNEVRKEIVKANN